MDTHRQMLQERIHVAFTMARNNPTTEILAAYGRAIMNWWDVTLFVAPQAPDYESGESRTHPPAGTLDVQEPWTCKESP